VSVECWYQRVDTMTEVLVSNKLTELEIKPNSVKDVDFILCSDHRKEAFRQCLRVVITLNDGTTHYVEYGGAGTVFGKDTPNVLEKSIMPWLTERLLNIHQSKFRIEDPNGDGKIVCSFIGKDEDMEPIDLERLNMIDHVKIYNTEDLKWMAILLGMADMSNEWCIFCMMRKLQWNERGHNKGELRIIQKILDIAADSTLKQAADRHRVKAKPYWDFIPVANFITLLLHILIGVFNDVDVCFMDIVDGHIIPVKEAEKKMHEDMKTIGDKIKPMMKAVAD